jgi:hypothetical protein
LVIHFYVTCFVFLLAGKFELVFFILVCFLVFPGNNTRGWAPRLLVRGGDAILWVTGGVIFLTGSFGIGPASIGGVVLKEEIKIGAGELFTILEE